MITINIPDKVKDIRAVIENNKLVIFVGAGVSNNSGIPTWSGLVKEFAKKLNYDNCEKCKKQKKRCRVKDCRDKYDFSQDELLKIPQYFYNSDTSKRHKDYFEVITNTLKNNYSSNPLNDMILNLFPKHIITTNYDCLLENSRVENTLLYDVIVEDKDLLTNSSNNYIIKMHGDINNLNTIVLKEDDYINYSQKHILIETYIKSLLVDHTFLFVGYSLNDYNLKLILGWIEYLAREHSVNKKRPKNYIIQVNDTPIEKHIENYFKSYNIYILNTYDLKTEIIEKYNDINLPEEGKKVYCILKYISDEDNDNLVEPLNKILLEKYKIFDTFKRISFEDLLSVHSLGWTDNIGGNLYFHNDKYFNELKPIIQSNGVKDKLIKKVFLKAGISAIQYKNDYIKFEGKILKKQTIDDELFELYLNNEYFKILTMLGKIDDKNLVAYYFYVITPDSGNLEQELKEIENNIKNIKNLYSLIVYKYNCILFKQMIHQNTSNDFKDFSKVLNNIPAKDKSAYRYIKKIIDDMTDNRFKCIKLFEKHENTFTKKDDTVYFSDINSELKKLRGIAYDYYFFIKCNNIMLDYFSNFKNYLEYYIKAIICTYTTYKERSIDSIFNFEQPYNEYELNAIDFDILIKYIDNKLIKIWASEYKVKKLSFKSNVNVVVKFLNFCDSMKIFRSMHYPMQFANFIFVISKCNLKDEEKNKIIEAIGKLIERKNNDINNIITFIFSDLEYLIKLYRNENISSFYYILEILLHDETINRIEERYRLHLVTTFKILSRYADLKIHDIVDKIIESQDDILKKINMINILYYLFSKQQKIKYIEMIRNNIKLVGIDFIFRYLVNKYIKFNDIIKDNFISIIQKEIDKKTAQPGITTYPDWLASTLDYCIILHLLGIWKNIDCLKPYIAYSDVLTFLLDANSFDYSKIDINNYMWKNIFMNKKYRTILMSHKEKIITTAKNALVNGYASEDQKKILYRYLLSENDIWNIK